MMPNSEARKRDAVAVPGADVEALAEALARHREWTMIDSGIAADGEFAWLRCSCGWSKNVELPTDDLVYAVLAWEDHVATMLAAYVAQQRAEAERERDEARAARDALTRAAGYSTRRYDALQARVSALADEWERGVSNVAPAERPTWGAGWLAASRGCIADLRAALRDEGGDQ